MDIRAAEISAILKEQIKNFGTEAEVTEVGQVLSVGDGIARCYGLDNVRSSTPITYTAHGQQYVAVVAGGGNPHDITWRDMTPEITDPADGVTLYVFKLPAAAGATKKKG